MRAKRDLTDRVGGFRLTREVKVRPPPAGVQLPGSERVRCVTLGRSIKGCTPLSAEFRKSFQGASVERIAIRGREASATFTNGEVVELWRNGWDIWMIGKVGEYSGRGF